MASTVKFRDLAAISMAGNIAEGVSFNRHFHNAYKAKKIFCPEADCVKKLLFFEENGLAHHYRVMHKKNVDMVAVKDKMHYFYGQETLRYVCILSQKKSEASSSTLITICLNE